MKRADFVFCAKPARNNFNSKAQITLILALEVMAEKKPS